MTKKNILAALIAAAMSVTVSATIAGASLTASAAACNNVDEEPEYALAPPIRMMCEEEIPESTWDDIRYKLDCNSDKEIHVNDAISFKRNGNDALATAVCNYILADGQLEFTVSPVSLKDISDRIKSEGFELTSVWGVDEDNDGKFETARFMFLNSYTGTFFVEETSTMSMEDGFVKLWDIDGDKAVTEKDAAHVLLEEENIEKADAIGQYAEYGNGGFAIQCFIPVSLSETLEAMLADGAEFVAADNSTYGITLFDYNHGITSFRYW